jgi:hypothetical protein
MNDIKILDRLIDTDGTVFTIYDTPYHYENEDYDPAPYTFCQYLKGHDSAFLGTDTQSLDNMFGGRLKHLRNIEQKESH